jgi:predicted transcriptional regulator YheO
MENTRLSATDKEILHSVSMLMEGLSGFLGDAHEIVLHSLENLEHSVIKIINGHFTGREVGAPITNLAIQMLQKSQSGSQVEQGITYFSENSKGEKLKSSTILIRGEKGKTIGLLCINHYLNQSLSDFLSSMTPSGMSVQKNGEEAQENYSQNTQEMIRSICQKKKKEVVYNTHISSSNKNREIIRSLYNKHIFSFKHAVPTVANELGISVNTVYLHLRSIKKGLGSLDR